MAHDMIKTTLLVILALVLQACGGSDFAMARDMIKTTLLVILALVLQACGGSDFAPESELSPTAGTSTPTIPVEPAPVPSVTAVPSQPVTVTPTYAICTCNASVDGSVKELQCVTTDLPNWPADTMGGCRTFSQGCKTGTEASIKIDPLPTTIEPCPLPPKPAPVVTVPTYELCTCTVSTSVSKAVLNSCTAPVGDSCAAYHGLCNNQLSSSSVTYVLAPTDKDGSVPTNVPVCK